MRIQKYPDTCGRGFSNLFLKRLCSVTMMLLVYVVAVKPNLASVSSKPVFSSNVLLVFSVLQFWEADHIIPVSEGGGECGLDNYRTLCVMCHKKATEELNRRLKHRKLLQNAVGYGDISTFFRPL